MKPSPARAAEEPWYFRAFERIYLEVYPHRDDDEAERHVPQVLGLLGVKLQGQVLDVACGAGRYARAMARRGVRVTGVDLSEDLLESAREQSPGIPGAPTYIRWDIRDLPFRSQFDGAVSLFTSFGYFEDPADDARLMRGVYRSLRPGGRFLVDYLNTPRVRRHLEPVTDRMTGRLCVRLERHIEEDGPLGPRVIKQVRATHRESGLELASYEERVRLYTPEEVDGLLQDAGFELLGPARGSLEGDPYDAEASPRFVRVARRSE
ncbi:MAG: class I SAM-dependent methyltransferase [Planctomycetota bacterium]